MALVAGLAMLPIAYQIAGGPSAKMEAFAAVCEGRGGVAVGRTWLRGERYVFAGVERHDGRWRATLGRLPSAATSGRARDVNVVLCFDDGAPQVIETCEAPGAARVVRTQQVSQVRAIAARSGALLGEGALRGATPPTCASLHATGRAADAAGPPPGADDTLAWINATLPPAP